MLLAILPAVQVTVTILFLMIKYCFLLQVEETCRSLIGALKSRTSTLQERTYCDILDRREIAGDAANKNNRLDLTNVFCDDEGRLPLEDAKRLVLKNLRILEVAGYTSSKDGCISIINDLAKDILDQRDHR